MRLLLVFISLTILTGWDLNESLQEVGAGIRKGVSEAEQGAKEAPAAIGEAGNQQEAELRKDSSGDEDDNASGEDQ